MNTLDLDTYEQGIKAHTASLAQMETLSLQLIAQVRRFETARREASNRARDALDSIDVELTYADIDVAVKAIFEDV